MTKEKSVRHMKPWTSQEDQTLARYVRARPQNLHKCFLMIAEQLGRTESAVQGRWYGHVSKDPKNLCFFTASPKHVSRNRKNGMGEESNPGIWRRLMTVLKSLTH